MANPNGAKGKQFERDVLDYARTVHNLDIEKQPDLGGGDDEGDHVVRTRKGLRFVVEAKNWARIDLPRFIREVVAETKSYAERRRLSYGYDPNPISDPRKVWPVVVVKARGKNVRESYAVMRYEDWCDLVARFC